MTGWRRCVAAVAGLTLAGTIAMAAGPASAQQSSTEVQVQAQAPAPAQPTEEPTRPRGDATQGPAVGAAAATEEKGPNTGRVGLVLGADWLSAYSYRRR